MKATLSADGAVTRRCYIAGAGEFCESILPADGDFVIAADGGYLVLTRRGIMPDLVVGDFDSLPEMPRHPAVVRLPAEKNDTDMLRAVKEGFARGCGSFIINGGLGGRFDHTLANIQVLAHIAQKGARCCLVGREICASAITNGTMRFSPGGGYISVFCTGDKAEGVTLVGLKYPLNNALLTHDFPLGISNEFTGVPASITVRRGTLIITWDGGFELINTNLR